MKNLDNTKRLLITLAALVLLPAMTASAATITTNQEDYAPWEVVTITGTGFAANSTVDILITWPDGYPDLISGIRADSIGGFTYKYEKEKFGGKYTVEAVDDANNTATTTFTDSAVNESVVDATAPTGSVTLAPGGSGPITINLTVTGNQVGTATFDVYRDWTLSGGTFTGSNAQTFTVNPRAAQDPATTFTTTGTVAVASGQTAGTFTLAVGAFNITNSNQTGAKLSAGTSSNYVVTVEIPTPSDTTPPVLSLPANITTEATSSAGAVVTFTATAYDEGDAAAVPVTCTPASGSTFAIGTTTVNCSASDSHGNTATGSFTVTVTETTGPVLSLPADIVAEATSSAGAVVTFSATATDAVDGPLAVTCVPASGSTFAIGVTIVTCSATDSHGNTTSGTFTVTVQDTTAPVLSLPADITAEATSAAGAEVTFTATATDAVDGSVAVISAPPSGSTFPLGTTTVDCSATDAHGNTATGSFTVTVQDTTPPTLTLPANIIAEATSSAGAAVTFTATATDIVDGPVTVVCTPDSGSTFALDVTTTVSCSATDAHGNTATGSFTVKVQDTTPPAITVPATLSVLVGAPKSVLTGSATDLVDGAVTPTNDAPAVFPAGVTTVTWTATDAHSNTNTATTIVTATYTFIGFLPPVDNQPTINVGKAGRTYPIKWQLKNYNNTFVGDLSVVTSLRWVCTSNGTVSGNVLEEETSGASGLRYDPIANQYIFTWQTQKDFANKQYTLTLTLSDGTTHQAYFSFTK